MYHSVDDSGSVISVSPSVFRRHMDWLHDQSFNVVPLSQLTRCLADGLPLPERSAVITFDDGFESVYGGAFPIMARYGFSASVFLVTDFCGKDNDWPGQPAIVPRLPLLNWSQVQEMARFNIEFGSHTLTHPRLDLISPADAENEIVNSRREIEHRLGQRSALFAYPYGKASTVADAAVRRHYDAAVGTRLRLANMSSDIYAIERLDAYYLQRQQLFALLGGPWCSVYFGVRRSVRAIASKFLVRAWA
jgi:peptidoglycan/xylan/chitin deacetylase (PgdA/CDA1 family)